ncbi:MAG: insulinase family protein [Ignavibacteriales bacterium]|nr:insulinase family protein [Ignavibacteriales bacterium]
MKFKIKLFALILIYLFAGNLIFSQNDEEVRASNYNYEDQIPMDPDVMYGEFDNGLKYYIRENKKPENRAVLWLAVNAGAVLEDDDQQGLAHFVEHMGFNGTKNFKKHELVDFLESIGMQFGPEINAYTSFDETVYFINVPTDSAYFMEKGMQILEEWAHNVSFEDEEIDKERGVVGEEWRLGRGAQMRMVDKQLPILFKDSKYANRLPIGKKEIIDNCSYETLRRFYKDWYRPDLMAVVAVGDFNKNWAYQLIEKHFSNLAVQENPRKRELFPVPDHKEVLFAIATDKEADRTQIGVYYKSEYQPSKTVEDYKTKLMANIYTQMFNNRLVELTKKADPPYLYGFTGQGRFVRTKEVYLIGALVKEGGVETGLDALLTEANRVKKYGFTTTEFERAKIEIMRSAERSFKERDKTESNNIARGFVYNFLNDNPAPNPEQNLALVKQLLPEIKVEEINELTNKWITENNRVVFLSAPEKENSPIPTEEELLAVFEKVNEKEIEPFVDKVSDKPLVAEKLTPKEIVQESRNENLVITELKLSNGINVTLKKTDFKNDEILFNSYSYGGNSLISDDDYMSGSSAAEIINESGVGEFNNIELDKKLTGKVVRVNPYISGLYEGISGSVSPEDIETMFQLIYLYFTAPRNDLEAFQSLKTRMKGFIENRSSRPETAFYDTIQVTLAQNHKRSRPLSEALLDEVDRNVAFNFYKDRFADASDFNFFFVGNFELEKIKPLIQTYLGNLPTLNRKETWKDNKVNPPKGVVKKEVYKGIEPKSLVRVTFTGSYNGEYKDYYAINSLAEVMRIKLREVLREDMGGTYGVSLWANTSLYPEKEYSFNISFGCNPERVDEMLQSLFIQIYSLKSDGASQINIDKVKEIQKRNYEVNLERNSFWLNELFWKNFYNDDLLDIINYPNYVNSLSSDIIKSAAKEYLNTENYVQVVMYPEDKLEQSQK